MNGRTRLYALAATLTFLLMGGCTAGGDITRPIPTAYYPAPHATQRVVVMLPGRGDDLASLEKRHAAALIQAQWPDADVILTGLTMPFYRQGHAPQRLHDEVIEPLLEAHPKRPVWLLGISLGGMGALLYDRRYPEQAAGLLLLSPYLGDRPIHREIRAAGGLESWRPGPAEPMTEATFQRELWRYLHGWADTPHRTRTVWITYGANERFRKPITLLKPVLPQGHLLERPGYHNWNLWKPAIAPLLQRANKD
ncbi:hypothetical protein GCM10027285_21140 [Oleiagrimonas citrea]|uniref:Alpha/beta hydrolase n=1 Tax=Oleiagrimonas citrea TaxID=1665687 RepID=A0A846ZJL9_9GAMM|nr:alpha/beta fold hydrolase [Oleiagrimonas citrea]NKZ37571.1 alpha/beta hydrolase [Oleiagrimonas citrea]